MITSSPLGVQDIAIYRSVYLFVCLSVCPFVYLKTSETTCSDFTTFSVHVTMTYMAVAWSFLL